MVNAYPETLDEALDWRAKGYRPIGGGTDLMVRYRSGSGLLPRFEEPLVFLRGVDELGKLIKEKDILRIGATVTLKELAESELTPEPFRSIILQMASFGIRSEATLAGNLGNASPAADSLPFLYCRDSIVVLASSGSERSIFLSKFITGPGKTVMEKNEIIREIRVPLNKPQISFHKKVGGRRSDAISKLSFYGEADICEDSVADVRLAFGSVAPRIVRSREGEEMLTAFLNGQGDMSDVTELYSQLITPIDDQRSTADYRKQVSLNLLARFTEKLS